MFLYLKGAGMGAADTVPGVSGGTIAFITGIYEELVDSIRSFDLEAAILLGKGQIKEFYNHVNATFLLVLFFGIATSALTLSRGILYLLSNHPILIWSFFFGLILSSAFTVMKKITKWSGPAIAAGILGLGAGYLVTKAVPVATPQSFPFVFLSGMIAICAMILPGISGSFILVILGKYEYVLYAIKDMIFPVILVFGAGAAIGLILFSRLLKMMLARFYNETIVFLVGVMIGSLNKVWPWKKVVATYVNSKGHVKPLIESNVLPWTYTKLTSLPAQTAEAALLMCAGFILVLLLDRFASGSTLQD